MPYDQLAPPPFNSRSPCQEGDRGGVTPRRSRICMFRTPFPRPIHLCSCKEQRRSQRVDKHILHICMSSRGIELMKLVGCAVRCSEKDAEQHVMLQEDRVFVLMIDRPPDEQSEDTEVDNVHQLSHPQNPRSGNEYDGMDELIKMRSIQRKTGR